MRKDRRIWRELREGACMLRTNLISRPHRGTTVVRAYRVTKPSFNPQSRSVTCSRSPAVSSTAFHGQSPDFPPLGLMDMGIAVICLFARHHKPSPVLVHRLASLLRASFGPPSTSVTSHLRFAGPPPRSDHAGDSRLQAALPARQKKGLAGVGARGNGSAAYC